MGASAHTFGESAFATTPDGRRLHHVSSGSGPATVVFESGLGMSRSSWGLVAPPVARHARAVVYDRANLGRSDADGEPRTLARLAGDLNVLLDALGPGPFVLVGHSWGGPIVRVAAAERPDRVQGLVLVDQTDERCDLYFGAAARRRFALTSALTPLLARVGLYRMAARPGRVQPADVAADQRAEDFSVAGARGMAAEMAPFVDEITALRDDPPSVEGIPVTVLTGTRATRMDRKVRAAIVAAHRQTADELGGRLVESPGSAHLIPFDDPGLVVSETEALLDQRQGPLRTAPSSEGKPPSG